MCIVQVEFSFNVIIYFFWKLTSQTKVQEKAMGIRIGEASALGGSTGPGKKLNRFVGDKFFPR